MGFLLGKLAWIVLRPGNLLLLLGVAGLVAGRTRAGRRLMALVLAVLAVQTVLPLGLWLTWPLEQRFPAPLRPPAQIDGIVALGGGIDLETSAARGQPALTDTGDRFAAFTELARLYPEARLIFTGGNGSIDGAPLSEAAVMRDYLARQGIDLSRISFDARARTTRDNAVRAVRLADPQPGERWLLVTTAAHMPRAVGCFRAAGFDVVPWPVDYRTARPFQLAWPTSLSVRLHELDDAAYEWAGLIYYRLLGYTDALFPAPRLAAALAAGGAGG